MGKPTVDEVEAAGGVPLVYADVPWLYNQKGRGAAENHYEEMPLDAVRALPVSRLASPDAALFMWGTWPQLPAVLDVMSCWGFEYKTCAFVWVKYRSSTDVKHVGGGFWTRANTEFCLLGVRGEGYPTRVSKSVRQLVETAGEERVLLAPLQRHSAKPPEARDRVVQLMGDLPRVELFARCVDGDGKVVPGGRVAPGWAQWGAECDSDFTMGGVG